MVIKSTYDEVREFQKCIFDGRHLDAVKIAIRRINYTHFKCHRATYFLLLTSSVNHQLKFLPKFHGSSRALHMLQPLILTSIQESSRLMYVSSVTSPAMVPIPLDIGILNTPYNKATSSPPYTGVLYPHVFIDTYTPPLREHLHPEALRSLAIINAGGKSEISEAYSIHHMSTLLGSTQSILEMEVQYWATYKMVDLIMKLPSGVRLGISVTRAMTRCDLEYTRDDAVCLLKKKIHGLIVSRNTVVRDQTFFQSVLHIWAPTHRVARMLVDVIHSRDVDFEEMDLIGTLDLWITVSDACEIYTNEWPVSTCGL